MAAPLRGTQSLVGQMGWVFQRPSLTAIEVAWRWLFGLPFLVVCWFQTLNILDELRPGSAGLSNFDSQNPWVAATQLSNAWALYQSRVAAVLCWLLPLAALAWVVVSGLGRSFILKRMDSTLRFRPVAMIALQAAWLAFFAVSINSCMFISVIGGSPNIFNRRLAPSAVDGHETASANHRSSNKPPWPPASKSRRTRCANHDGHVANKEVGRDESAHHSDLRATCVHSLIHS